jgi:hypothetical protein
MNSVFYLCFSLEEEKSGFVFPSELDKNIYSPGIFIVIAPLNYRFEDTYIFEAFDRRRHIKLELRRARKNTFLVSTKKYGTFFFKAKLIQKTYNNYLGRHVSPSSNERLYEIIPLQPQRLEDVCRKHNFFFLGSIEESNRRAG